MTGRSERIASLALSIGLISFLNLTEDFFVLPPEEAAHLGDVVISFPRVESQADEAGHSRERELAFLTVHAVLHILGMYKFDCAQDAHLFQKNGTNQSVKIAACQESIFFRFAAHRVSVLSSAEPAQTA